MALYSDDLQKYKYRCAIMMTSGIQVSFNTHLLTLPEFLLACASDTSTVGAHCFR
jgi:hypothetical protein